MRRQGLARVQGQYGKLFVFELSFIGWYLLPIGVTCLCLLVGLAGLKVIAGATGIAVLVLALVAVLCLDVVIGGFVSAYTTTSFIGMYEYLAAPAAGEDIPAAGRQLLAAAFGWNRIVTGKTAANVTFGRRFVCLTGKCRDAIINPLTGKRQ